MAIYRIGCALATIVPIRGAYPWRMADRSRKREPKAPPTPEEEAAAYARGLARRGRIAPCDKEPMPPGTTHVVERRGTAKRLKRKRFS